MSNDEGPWGRVMRESDPEPAPAPPPRRRRGLWFLLLFAAVGAIVVALAKAFPEAVQGPDGWANVGYGLTLVVLVSTAAFRVQRGALRQHLRHAAIWAGVVAALALVVAYREEFAGVPQRLRLAFSVGDPVATGDHELVVPQDDQGAFVIVARVNGQRVRFIVDTGATDTVLSPADARRLGVPVDQLVYDGEAETANGVGHAAAYTAQTLEVGAIRFDQFRMAVNQAPMSSSLLGMSFLNRLESFEVRGRKLILKWRDERQSGPTAAMATPAA